MGLNSGSVWSDLFQALDTKGARLMWLTSVLVHGGKEAQLIFFILAKGSFTLPTFMRTKALCLASLMSQVLKLQADKQDDSGSVDLYGREWSHCHHMFMRGICTNQREGLHLAFSEETGCEVTSCRGMKPHKYFSEPVLSLVGCQVWHMNVSSVA